MSTSAEYEAFLKTDDDFSYTERDHWLRYELVNSKIKTERHDTEFAGMHTNTKYEFDVSALWRFTRLPATLKLEGQFGDLNRTVTISDSGTLLVETNMNIPRQSIPLEQIEAFNNYLGLLLEESTMNMQGVLKVNPK